MKNKGIQTFSRFRSGSFYILPHQIFDLGLISNSFKASLLLEGSKKRFFDAKADEAGGRFNAESRNLAEVF